MTFEPRPGDLDIEGTSKLMQQIMTEGGIAWVKWTCPGCGERCVADLPFQIVLSGYVHTTKKDGSPCGVHYTGGLYGVRAEFILSAHD